MLKLDTLMAFFIFISIILSCNPKTSEHNPTLSSTDNTTDTHNSSISSQDSLTNTTKAISHKVLFNFFPKSIDGYKTVGYPDEEDNFTGLPTGETESNFTSPKFMSFAKHLFESKSGNLLAIEVIDYNPNKESLNGFYKMYNGGTGIDDKAIKTTSYDLGIGNTQTLIREFVTLNKAEMHVFICNRFLINLQISNSTNNIKELKKAASLLNIRHMADIYCQ